MSVISLNISYNNNRNEYTFNNNNTNNTKSSSRSTDKYNNLNINSLNTNNNNNININTNNNTKNTIENYYFSNNSYNIKHNINRKIDTNSNNSNSNNNHHHTNNNLNTHQNNNNIFINSIATGVNLPELKLRNIYIHTEEPYSNFNSNYSNNNNSYINRKYYNNNYYSNNKNTSISINSLSSRRSINTKSKIVNLIQNNNNSNNNNLDTNDFSNNYYNNTNILNSEFTIKIDKPSNNIDNNSNNNNYVSNISNNKLKSKSKILNIIPMQFNKINSNNSINILSLSNKSNSNNNYNNNNDNGSNIITPTSIQNNMNISTISSDNNNNNNNNNQNSNTNLKHKTSIIINTKRQKSFKSLAPKSFKSHNSHKLITPKSNKSNNYLNNHSNNPNNRSRSHSDNKSSDKNNTSSFNNSKNQQTNKNKTSIIIKNFKIPNLNKPKIFYQQSPLFNTLIGMHEDQSNKKICSIVKNYCTNFRKGTNSFSDSRKNFNEIFLAKHRIMFVERFSIFGILDHHGEYGSMISTRLKSYISMFFLNEKNYVKYSNEKFNEEECMLVKFHKNHKNLNSFSPTKSQRRPKNIHNNGFIYNPKKSPRKANKYNSNNRKVVGNNHNTYLNPTKSHSPLNISNNNHDDDDDDDGIIDYNYKLDKSSILSPSFSKKNRIKFSKQKFHKYNDKDEKPFSPVNKANAKNNKNNKKSHKNTFKWTEKHIYSALKYNNYEMIRSVFNKAEKDLVSLKYKETLLSGAKLTLIFLIGEKCIVSNIGDIQSYNVKKNQTLQSTKITKMNNLHDNSTKAEKQRIQAKCGKIIHKNSCNRLYDYEEEYPGLNVSRIFGNTYSKNIGAISEPDITEFDMTHEIKALVIMTNPLSKVISDSKIGELVVKNYPLNEIAIVGNKIMYESYKYYVNVSIVMY